MYNPCPLSIQQHCKHPILKLAVSYTTVSKFYHSLITKSVHLLLYKQATKICSTALSKFPAIKLYFFSKRSRGRFGKEFAIVVVRNTYNVWNLRTQAWVTGPPVILIPVYHWWIPKLVHSLFHSAVTLHGFSVLYQYCPLVTFAHISFIQWYLIQMRKLSHQFIVTPVHFHKSFQDIHILLFSHHLMLVCTNYFDTLHQNEILVKVKFFCLVNFP